MVQFRLRGMGLLGILPHILNFLGKICPRVPLKYFSPTVITWTGQHNYLLKIYTFFDFVP